MTRTRKLIGAAAFTLALAGGGAAGAVLGAPAVSGAADDDPTEDGTDTGEGRRWQHHGEMLEAAAEALGVSADELRAELADGSSIAQVAEAQGVEVDTVVEALVAHATERLEELEALLPERMSALVEREGVPERPSHRRGPGRWAPVPDAAS